MGGDHEHNNQSNEKPSRKTLGLTKIRVSDRDLCSKDLVELEKCRQQTSFAPWKCKHERHHYEQCEYDLLRERYTNAYLAIHNSNASTTQSNHK